MLTEKEKEISKLKTRFYFSLFMVIVAILLNIFTKFWNFYHTLMVVYWFEFSDLKNQVRDLQEKLNIVIKPKRKDNNES